MPVNPIPDGYHTLTPALNVKDAHTLIDFLKNAFGAEERSRMQAPGGPVMHAELKIGDSMLMLSEAMMESPTASALILYVKDCDAVWKQAQDAGAKSIMAPEDMFWGDRFARVVDPFGNRWGIATHREDVAPDEMERRAKEWMAKNPQP